MSDLAAPDDDRRPARVYDRVADDLAQRIRSGELSPGTRLRSERELAGHYGIAYATMRKAMQLLRERGYIRTVHGEGTFVQPESEWP